MSHESLASLWSAIIPTPDVSSIIREAVGSCALSLVVLEDINASTRVHLIYALELTTICDYIRSSKNIKPSTRNGREGDVQRSLCQAMIYLLRNLSIEHVCRESSAQLCLQIIERALLSLLCTLRSTITAEYPNEISVFVSTAQQLSLNLSKEGDQCLLLREICAYIISAFDKSTSRPTNGNTNNFCGNIYYVHSDARPEMIERLIEHATDVETQSTDRITAVLEICQLYWETDAMLIQSCMTKMTIHNDQPPGGLAVVSTVAMQIRLLIQEYMVNASLTSRTELWSLALGHMLLFSPGLGGWCAIDACQCVFDGRDVHAVQDMRKQKPKILQRSLGKFQFTGTSIDCARDLQGAMLENFSSWLGPLDRGHHGQMNGQMNGHVNRQVNGKVDIKGALVPTRSPPCVEMDAHQVYSPSVQKPPSALASPVPCEIGVNSTNVSRHTSQRAGLFNRQFSFPTINESTQMMFEGITAHSPPPLSDSGNPASDQHSRANSITTITSSQDGRRPTFDTNILNTSLSKESDESNKIVVAVQRENSSRFASHPEPIYPEVVIQRTEVDNISLLSDSSLPVTVMSSTRNSGGRGRWGNILRGKKDSGGTFNAPKFRFFASGAHILLWTRHGGGVLDPSQIPGDEITPIREPDITYAVGGTKKFVLISRIAESYKLSVYSLDTMQKVGGWDIGRPPGAMDISRDDRYLALKYTKSLQLYDFQKPGSVITHKLPIHDSSRPGPDNHLISFAADSASFMAATRFQPEKVYTYWSLCTQTASMPWVATCSSAPFGNMEDHGLSSLVVCGPTVRNHPSGFLSTFTEKGYPVILHMNHKAPAVRSIRDPKEQMGTRIHCAAANTDANSGKTNLVLVNQNNSVFWISDVFGRDIDSRPISNLKRTKSLKPEIEISMSSSDEASIFWIDKQTQKAVLVKVGKSGGKAAPVYYRLDVEPLCG